MEQIKEKIYRETRFWMFSRSSRWYLAKPDTTTGYTDFVRLARGQADNLLAEGGWEEKEVAFLPPTWDAEDF